MPALLSRAALKFKNKTYSLEEDIELLDVLSNVSYKSFVIFNKVNPEKHSRLSHRKNNPQTRRIVIRHFIHTMYGSFIKDLYEELTLYLKELVYEAAIIAKDEKKANRLIGDSSIPSYNVKEILQYKNLNELIQNIANNIVQSLENERSTKELIKKICNKLDLKVEKHYIDEALPYLELRHKLVHADGKADYCFKRDFPSIKVNEKDRIILNYTVVTEAKEAITRLVNEIDREAIAKGILKPN